MSNGLDNDTLLKGNMNEQKNVIESFQGSMINKLANERILLKSILYGLIFYLFANPRTFKYTNYITNALDKILVHAIIFTFLVFILEQTI